MVRITFAPLYLQSLAMALGMALLSVTFCLAGNEPGKEPSSKNRKAELKEWKKRLKATDPLALKKLIEDKDLAQREAQAHAEKATVMQSQLSNVQEELARLKASMDAATAPAPNTEDASKQAYQQRHEDITKGVVFKVQIGAFRNKDLAKYLDNNQNFSGDTDTDGARKYTLGYFANYWEADNFKKYLREMGVTDAWTVAYKDGTRVALKEVLEGTAVVQK